MEQLVDGISTLCNLDRKFHSGRREHELKSLIRYMSEFRDFSEADFIRFVCRQYIECLRNRKRFCSESIYNRVSAIQSRLDINVMTRRRYVSVLKNLRKLFNPYNSETKFYTNTGNLVQIPPEEFRMLRENAKYLIDQNNTRVPDRWVLNTYTDEEIEVVYNYFKRNLENFLSSSSCVVDKKFDLAFVELCMLIVFNYNTPRRIAEIMNLRLYQVEELIVRNMVNIKSKDGYSIDCIYVSVALADLLNRFVLKLYPKAFETYSRDFKIFTSTYRMYYSRMRKTLKTLIGEDRLKNLRIFHGFRNYFANKHLNSDNTQECRRILGHNSTTMTKRYARGQRKESNCEQNRKQKVLQYLNDVAEK